jgi:apolipoprotein D and lipocalin family protein
VKKIKCLFLYPILFTGCLTNYPPLDTVKEVSIERYLGTWYEIARYDQSFQQGCSDVTATYSLKDNGDIKVVNRCTTKEHTFKESIGSAYATDVTNSKLKVTFFWPFYGNYWIVMLDSDYTYAVVGDPSRKYLWILSRNPKLSPHIKSKILAALPSFGYDIKALLWTKHTLKKDVR